MRCPRDDAQIAQKHSSHGANIRICHDIAKIFAEKLQSREAAMQWGISPIAALASGGARLMSALAPGEAEGVPGGAAGGCKPQPTQSRAESRAAEGRGAVPTGAGRRALQRPTSRTWHFTFVKYKRNSLILFDFGKIHVFCGDVLLYVARLQGSVIRYYKCKAGLYKCKAGILQM